MTDIAEWRTARKALTASPSVKERVLKAVEAGPCYPEGETEYGRWSAYAKYNVLAWLKSVAPKWPEVQRAFELVQEQNPEFRTREHPDFDMWMTSGDRGGVEIGRAHV